MGAVNTSSIVSIQSSVPWQRRATATAGNLLMRLLGNSAGAALLGGILNASLGARIARSGAGAEVDIAAIERIMSPEVAMAVPAGAAVPDAAAVPDVTAALLRQILAGGLHDVFLVVFLSTALLLALTLAWPRERRLE